MFYIISLFLLCIHVAFPAWSVVDYSYCVSVVKEDPDQGYEVAQEWISQGGGIPAQHCSVLALEALELYDASLEGLQKIVQNLPAEDAAWREHVLNHMVKIQMIAGYQEAAIGTLSAIIDLNPDDGEVYIDRAALLIRFEQYQQALNDLDHVIEMLPFRAFSYVMRSKVHRMLGSVNKARVDALYAIRIDQDLLEAWYELAETEQKAGHLDLARQYWRNIMEKSPESPIAQDAEQRIASTQEEASDLTP